MLAKHFQVRFSFVLRAVFSVLLGLILLQDILVFPELARKNLFSTPNRRLESLPAGVSSFLLKTDDDRQIEIWRVPVAPGVNPIGSAILYHGNGGTIDNFYGFLVALAKRGYLSYGMEYRGYGVSTGWPSSKKIMSDVVLTTRAVAQRENIPASDILQVGVSLGSGFALYGAKEFGSKHVLLITPYTSLKEAARNHPIFGFLSFILWNDVQSSEYLKQLSDTCITAVHGTADVVIPYEHSLKLKEAYNGNNKFLLITAEASGHNDAFWNKEQEVFAALNQCYRLSFGLRQSQ